MKNGFKMRTWLIILMLVASVTICLVCIIICKNVPVTVVSIPADIHFTNEYNPDAYLCLPAAYTTACGEIEGQYRIDGTTQGEKTLKEYISIHPTYGLEIGPKWCSDNGSQQHVLVKNHNARHFKDTRKRYRRALCNKSKSTRSYLIIESTYPMTLTEFAEHVSRHNYNAVNLDMGEYGYGWIGKSARSRWAKYYRKHQTSWIICE